MQLLGGGVQAVAQPELPWARQPLLPALSISHNLGAMDVVCPACRALHFVGELSTSYPAGRSSPFRRCCQFGVVDLLPLADPPVDLRDLLSSTDEGEVNRKVF